MTITSLVKMVVGRERFQAIYIFIIIISTSVGKKEETI